MKYFFLAILIIVLAIATYFIKTNYNEADSTAYEEGEELLTGYLGINSTSANAFGFEIDGLTFAEKSKFATGNSLFNQNWVASPASTTARDGLGPTFNARACATCHFKDGRGKPLVNGKSSNGFLMRISLDGHDDVGDAIAVPNYGKQLQDRAINGVLPEAQVTVAYETISGSYPDGKTYELQKPIYSFINEKFGSLSGVNMSPRVAQQTIGLGLISALPDAEITKYEDKNDTDGDGISGIANKVYNYETNTTVLGKYGWKANAPSLKQQVAGAFHGDMGLTTSLFKSQNCPPAQKDCKDSTNGGNPEVTDEQLDKILFYQAHLAVPNRRNYKEESVLKGKVLFNKLNCIGCHAINQVTGKKGLTPYLEGITIKPYSDFILHDMGANLADNRTDFLASGNEWRTQPLWGIGLISTVNKHTFLLHDGRARNIEEAILWHGGEAEKSKNAFKNCSLEERKQVINFIKSL